MTLETCLAFCIAAAIVLLIPGPTILSVISYSLAYGNRAVIPLVIGVVLGDFTALTLSLLGLGAILAASDAFFSCLKLFGALYLIHLGLRLWRSDDRMEASCFENNVASCWSLTTKLFVVTAMNPKSIAFFVAFLPQFVAPSAQVLPQLIVLGGTFLFLAAVNATLYALFSGHLRERMRSTHVRRWLDRCGGTALIGAGFLTAAMRRS